MLLSDCGTSGPTEGEISAAQTVGDKTAMKGCLSHGKGQRLVLCYTQREIPDLMGLNYRRGEFGLTLGEIPEW